MVVNERHFNVFHSTNHMFDDDDGAFLSSFILLVFSLWLHTLAWDSNWNLNTLSMVSCLAG